MLKVEGPGRQDYMSDVVFIISVAIAWLLDLRHQKTKSFTDLVRDLVTAINVVIVWARGSRMARSVSVSLIQTSGNSGYNCNSIMQSFSSLDNVIKLAKIIGFLSLCDHLSVGTQGRRVHVLPNACDDIFKRVWHSNGHILQVLYW